MIKYPNQREVEEKVSKALPLMIVAILVCSTFSVLTPQATAPGSGSFLVLWQIPVADNKPAYVAAGDVDGDGVSDIAIVPNLSPDEAKSIPSTLQLVKSDGTTLWSIDWMFTRASGVAVRDIDEDDKGEVFVHGDKYTGEPPYGWSAYVYALDHNGIALWEYQGPAGDIWSVIEFVNLDDDTEPEILLHGMGWEKRTCYALDTDGSLLWTFNAPNWLCGEPAIADVNNDGRDEIVLGSYRDLYVVDINGNLLTKIACPWGDKFVSSGDLTGDGIPDIASGACGSDVSKLNALYAYANDGTPLWSKLYANQMFQRGPRYPLLEDLTGDGLDDVTVYVDIEDMIASYGHDGTLLWTFGDSTFFDRATAIIGFFDINHDGVKEIVFAKFWSGSGDYSDVYALDWNGELVFGSPLPQPGQPVGDHDNSRYATAADVNDDGLEDLLALEAIGDQYYVAAITTVVPVFIDIKPGSWPNPIDTRSKGVFAVAICGTEDFDVRTIDPATVRICIEGVQQGVSPVRWSYGDVATPYTGSLGGGHALGGDGYLDLVLHFDTQTTVTTLGLAGHVGETVPLIIKGNLYVDTPIQGQDYVLIRR